MSNTAEWQNRSANYRYSQDDRVLSYKYKKEIEPIVNKFLDSHTSKKLLIGTFDVSSEPWKLLAIADYRKFGLKMRQYVKNKETPNLVSVTLVKSSR